MTTTQTKPSAFPSTVKIKMEDRKRPLAVDADDLAPGRKRVLKDENGQVMRMDADTERDIENFQKDALLRQMKEYKRERNSLQEQYNDLQRKCHYHDDHLRTIDAWFAQLLDEVRLLTASSLPTPPPSATSVNGIPVVGKDSEGVNGDTDRMAPGSEIYGSALLFDDNESFSEHLKARSTNIKTILTELFGRVPTASPDLENLRRKLGELLANEKIHAVELRNSLDQQQSLHERLENACMRYITAEKKLERAKSLQVAKLEKQAMMGGADLVSPTAGRKPGTPKRESTEANGEMEGGVAGAEVEAARKEAVAVAQRQKAQLLEIEKENERLTNELSAARTKLASMSDDDYAETSLFKGLRSQHDDMIKRVNHLEATNLQLREEAQKLHAERTAYRSSVDEESRNQIIETEAQRARAETDLTRIRNGRDEILSELSIRKSADANRTLSADQAKELAAARDAKITALQSEVDRLKLQLGESAPMATDVEALDLEALKNKLRNVETQYSLLSKELPSMEIAWRKAQALASRKIEEIAAWEEQVARLGAEKAKADQKYFAAMKAKDLRDAECRTLKSQNARSTEIVAQLKDVDGRSRELIVNLERQVAEAKDSLFKVETQCRAFEQKSKESTIAGEGLKKQMEELKSIIANKDREAVALSKSKREVEEEVEKTKSKLETVKQQYEDMRRNKATLSDNDINDGWRKLAICPVCNRKIRDSALKLCGHTFCDECVGDLISNRSRKCPSCGKAFGAADKMKIVLA